MGDMWNSLQQTLGSALPDILGGLAILLVGWFVALLARAVVVRGLGSLKLDERLSSSTGSKVTVQRTAGLIAYWVILLIAVIAFFNVLELEQVSGSLQTLVDQVLAYAPKLLAGAVLLLIAWVLATVVRSLVGRVLGSTKLDEKLAEQAGMSPMSSNVGTVMYWLVILLFLPAVLAVLELQGLLAPVQGMVDDVLAMLPNVVAAAAIGLAGWLIARIVRDLVGNLLAAVGTDGLGERAGLKGKLSLSRLIALVVYFLVLVPVLIAALDALKIEAISGPATEMLGTVMAAVPNIFGALIILGVAWFIAVFLSSVVSTLLASTGFDGLPERLGLWRTDGATVTPSQFSGKVIVFFVMLFAVVEAAGRLGFVQVSAFLSRMIDFGGQVLVGVAIIAVGLWLSQLAYRAMQRTGTGKSAAMAGIVRFAIVGIVVAMGLRAMGLADDIVNLAFGLTLGSVAVAVALSFGLGGREAAGKQMEHWFQKLRGP
ncbi:MAG: mechanosensitive ion channel [Planctomycetota bacterium]